MAKRKNIPSRKVPILNMHSVERVDSEVLSETYQLKTFVYTETPKAIEEALRTRKQVATLCQINNQDAFIEIQKEDWCIAIDRCIAYQSEKEQYELCSELRDIRARIDKSKKQLV